MYHCCLLLGELVLAASEKKGLGIGLCLTFKCSGCWLEEVAYKSSQLALDSRRQLVSLALSLAFFVSGYRKTLGKGLGLSVVSDKPYLYVIHVAFPYIKEILDEICDDVKNQMKDISPDVIGSWSCAVTTCDGCWQIRGYFSQNCTFIIKKLSHRWSNILWPSVYERCRQCLRRGVVEGHCKSI